MNGVFAGVRVVDFTTTIAGPHCTRMMADLGAEIVKIEAPEGDMMRARPPLRDGCSTSFGQLNGGKQSVVLDLKTPLGVEAARRLAARADILVENFRPGVMDRFGLDCESLSRANAGLIYCAISGYGRTGPAAGLPAYAPVIHAASGYDVAHLAYQGGRAQPDCCGIYIADVLSGTYAFGAISAALYQRRATGRGQLIDVSMLESMLSLTLSEIQTAQFPVATTTRPLFGPVATGDGYVMVAIASERTFHSLCAAAGHPEWRTDARFADYADRRIHWDAFLDGVEAWSRRLTTPECLTVLQDGGVPASPYRTVREALDDPQLAHRGALAEFADSAGSFLALNPPFRMSDSPLPGRRRVPALGENTASLLADLGLADENAGSGI